MALPGHDVKSNTCSWHVHGHALPTSRARWKGLGSGAGKTCSDYPRISFGRHRKSCCLQGDKTSAHTGTCRPSSEQVDNASPHRCPSETKGQASGAPPKLARRDWLLATAGSAALGTGNASLAAIETQAPQSPAKMPLPQQRQLQAAKTEPQGIQAIRDPAYNRGLATDRTSRARLSMQGLLPPAVTQLHTEIDRAHAAVSRCCTPLDKYQAIMALRDASYDCFFGLISQNIEEYLPIIYTPTVGEACQRWSDLLFRPQGLYLSIEDRGSMASILEQWPQQDVRLVVLTDGERILGLGDLGCNGMGIPVGKATVHTAAAGIHPNHILPVALDVGTNNEGLRAHPLYVGLPQARVRDGRYDDLVEEFVTALRRRYGPSLLLHWEDFAASNAFRLLSRYRGKGYATFNDDIQATAAVTLGALLGAGQLPGVPPLPEQVFLLFGAGQANLGFAQLLLEALTARGFDEAEAKKRIWLMDSQGIVYKGREGRPLSAEKEAFARHASDAPLARDAGRDLLKAVRLIRPCSLIGAAAKGGAFTQDIVRAVKQATVDGFGKDARPLLFALSNPVEEAECTAQQAYDWTDGTAVYVSGTAFPPVRRTDGSTFVPGQCNNCLVFPGIALGCMAAGATQVTDRMIMVAAQAVAREVTQQELQQGSVLPRIERLREVASAVAASVMLEAMQGQEDASQGAGSRPRTVQDARELLATMQYDPFMVGSGL